MIRINLALKKSPLEVSGGSSPFGMDALDFATLKELPLLRWTVGIVVSGLLYFGVGEWKTQELSRIQIEIQSREVELVEYRKDLAKIAEIETIKSQVEKDQGVIDLKIKVIESLIQSRQSATQMLLYLSEAIPAEVWLKDIRVSKESVQIQAGSLGFANISDFMQKLGQSAYFVDVELKSSRQEPVMDGQQPIMTFELGAKKRVEP